MGKIIPAAVHFLRRVNVLPQDFVVTEQALSRLATMVG
jgi:hypothetical protein